MDVLEFLVPRGLAWDPEELDRSQWVAVHPDLGTAIMSYITIAIARSKGLDIVTDSSSAHLAVATQDEDLVFEELMRGRYRRPRTQGEPSEKVDELVQVVMESCFDVSRLTPRQIADLLNDGKDLRAFKQALVPLAQTIPDISDLEERKKRLKAAADEVIDMWQAYRKSLPRFALDAIVNATKVEPPALFGTLASGGVSGHYMLGIEGAFLFGFVAYAGIGAVREWRERVNSPYKYLTKIQKAGAVLTVAR